MLSTERKVITHQHADSMLMRSDQVKNSLVKGHCTETWSFKSQIFYSISCMNVVGLFLLEFYIVGYTSLFLKFVYHFIEHVYDFATVKNDLCTRFLS